IVQDIQNNPSTERHGDRIPGIMDSSQNHTVLLTNGLPMEPAVRLSACRDMKNHGVRMAGIITWRDIQLIGLLRGDVCRSLKGGRLIKALAADHKRPVQPAGGQHVNRGLVAGWRRWNCRLWPGRIRVKRWSFRIRLL